MNNTKLRKFCYLLLAIGIVSTCQRPDDPPQNKKAGAQNQETNQDTPDNDFDPDNEPDNEPENEPDLSPPGSVTDPSCGFTGENSGPKLVINNLQPGVVVPHQLVMLTGKTASSIKWLTTVHGDHVQKKIPVIDENFRVFFDLKRGLNYVGIWADGHAPTCFKVSFKEPANANKVKYIVFTASDSKEGVFKWLTKPNSPPPGTKHGCLVNTKCDISSIVKRMQFMALVNQMQMAETLVAGGSPRKTFTLARGSKGEVLDPLFISKRTANKLLSDATSSRPQESGAVMSTAAKEIIAREEAANVNTSKFKYVMIFRDIQTGAWGGGKNASLGGGSFNVWPGNLKEFYSRLFDNRDPLQSGVPWTNAPTVSLSFTRNSGALLHELGHALGMGHPAKADTTCKAIMGSGFQSFHTLLIPGKENTTCWTKDSGNNVSNHQAHVTNSPWIAAP